MKTALRVAAGVFLSVTFIVSGAIKLKAPDRFLLDVEAFHLVPAWLAYGTALVLPWVEVIGALALWLPKWRRGAAFLLAASTVSFIGALSIAEARGLDLECGCFGDWLVFPSFGVHLLFNAVLLLSSVWLMFPTGRKTP